jgi:N,N'-diacetyllegionaminate synthase
MKIGDHTIGEGHRPYVIAEIGVNHDGDADKALLLVDHAAHAGAHAIKLQYFETDRLMSRHAVLAAYQADAGETDPIEMLRRLELPLDDMARIVERAHALGLHAIVTVFSVELVASAAELAWDAFKTASPDIINRPLLDAIAARGRPMIVSTGASTMDEVTTAADWLASARDRLAFLQCVSAYPAPDSALGGIGAIARATGLPVGYSDHTPSIETGAEAVRAGAAILEKHLTYDTSAAGPDHAASLDPASFAAYTGLILDRVPRARTGGEKIVLEVEQDVRRVSRQSIIALRDLRAGATLRPEDLTIKRPGTGIAPWAWDSVIGRELCVDIAADTPIRVNDLA